MRQEGILLGFVEAMDFIDEEEGAFLAVPLGLGDNQLDLFIPDVTAEKGTKRAFDLPAIMRAIVVLPVPGGPQSMMEPTRSSSIARRSGVPGFMSLSWPTNSSSVRGRMRSASGGLESD
jgi:hypothetical protein